VSRFLSIECDPIDQPAAHDPVERRTWCALRIRVGGRTVTRMWDRTLGEERSLLYLPAFPIAQWVVENWWTLLNEPSPTAELPRPSSAHLPWIKRHCLRSAESGLLLPALYLFNDGRGIGCEWQADDPEVFPNMPGEFADSGIDHLEKGPTEDILAEFVSEILRRLNGLSDERVERLRENWRAIRSADDEEATFCVVVARMGVDPYDAAQVSADLAAFVENAIGDPELPLVRDLTEAARVHYVASQWSWVQQTKITWNLGPTTRQVPVSIHLARPSPSGVGYRLAAIVRQLAGLVTSDQVNSVAEVAETVAKVPFRTQEQNHIPGSGLRAIVGWKADREIVVAGPRPSLESSVRFLAARGLYHALFTCDRSERLVTDAYTWDQQVSRAFAAEFLAPQAALTARTGERTDHSKVEELAREFGASTIVIEKQLENAGVEIIVD
jgi:hypothetical protein